MNSRGTNNTPIRVLHVFGALNPGGVETLVLNIYRCIDRTKVQFDFALTQGVRSLYDDEVLSMGGRIFYFDTSRPITSNLSEILKKQGPFAVLHSHLYFFSGAFVFIAARYGVPIRIAHAHNTSFGQRDTLIRRVYEWVMRKLILKYATDLLGCSVDACEFVFGQGCMKDPRCRVLYNGFDVKAFCFHPEDRERIRSQYGLENRFVVGHVGRFEDQKNHMQLVEQFSAVCKLRSDAALLLVGRGSLMDAVKEKCRRLGISDRVIYAGAQKHPAPFLSAMDVFLFPSLYEGLGSALIEAQANGLHVVTSADVVPKDIDLTGNAVFVLLSDGPEKWARAVVECKMRENPEQANSIVFEKYDIHKVAEIMTSLYVRSLPSK